MRQARITFWAATFWLFAVDCGATQLRFEVAEQHIDYREFQAQQQLIRESGAVTQRRVVAQTLDGNPLRIQLEYSEYRSHLNYDGRSQGGRPLLSETQYRQQAVALSLFYSMAVSAVSVSPYVRWAHSEQTRTIHPTATTVSMGIKNHWQLWQLGVLVELPLKQRWDLHFDLGSQASNQGRVTVDLSAVELGQQSAARNKGEGWIAESRLNYEYGSVLFGAGVRYRRWDWQASDVMIFSGEVVRRFQEPASESKEASVFISIGYSFAD